MKPHRAGSQLRCSLAMSSNYQAPTQQRQELPSLAHRSAAQRPRARDETSLDGQASGRSIEDVEPQAVLYLGLLPSPLISPHPGYVMTHHLTPLAPDRTRIESKEASGHVSTSKAEGRARSR